MVAGEAENPYVGLTVYVFDGSTYSGYSAITDAAGKVVFVLPLGESQYILQVITGLGLEYPRYNGIPDK
jgi:hypothetical protein